MKFGVFLSLPLLNYEILSSQIFSLLQRNGNCSFLGCGQDEIGENGRGVCGDRRDQPHALPTGLMPFAGATAQIPLICYCHRV